MMFFLHLTIFFKISCLECDHGYIYFENSCYKFNTTVLSRTLASAYCHLENAHLVDITSQTEQDFVVHLLETNRDIEWLRARETQIPRDVGAWIGLMESDTSGELMWSDGTSLDHHGKCIE